MDRILIYGAYGYTGRLIATRASRRGVDVVAAGRDAKQLEEAVGSLGLETRVFGLQSPSELEAGLAGVAVVVHCAGPFIHTSQPMLEACLAVGAHYVDITGELAVFRQLRAAGARAKARGISVLPGAGFDVVPTDCLALHLSRRLPTATHLALAFKGSSRPSRGTLRTALGMLPERSAVRRGGELVRIASGSVTREIDLGSGPELCIAIPMGDLCTAHHSTGIGNIEVYAPAGRAMAIAARGIDRMRGVLASRPAQRALSRLIGAAPSGPSAAERARGKSVIWGEVRDAAQGRASARLIAPDGYSLTSEAALEIAKRLAGGQVPPGFQTPAAAFGADFVLELSGVEREDL